ncbi:MAG: bifunctional oligoribonuclease/PAP phosphatase NrnA [Chthoniobacterales bacterium]|nr:bifunctional oligoribonuclease/PAP phosphatase NrnA [Chthoniobacterales bacterium]
MFDEILAPLKSARRVLVASHVRPDADALGSTLAAALWLRGLGKEVVTWNEDGMPEKFRYLPGHEGITAPPEIPEKFDVFLALDTSVKNRLGSVVNAIAPGALWINIDHHVSNECYGDINHVDPTSPATGQILYEFFRAIGVEISHPMADNLFAAISTDTGSFQYQGTDSRTFEAGAGLIAAGVDVATLSRAMYENQPRRRFELLRFALNRTEFHCADRIATFSLTMEDAGRLGVLPEDNEGIIDQVRSIEGVQAAIFFEELPEGRVRVSARSKNPALDVCKICQIFKGGGHRLAAGARISGSLAQVREEFLKVVSDEILKRD